MSHQLTRQQVFLKHCERETASLATKKNGFQKLWLFRHATFTAGSALQAGAQ